MIAVGPLRVDLKLPAKANNRHARLLVAGKTVVAMPVPGGRRMELKSLYDRETLECIEKVSDGAEA